MSGDHRHYASWQLVWGIMLILSGMLFLLDRFYVFDLAQVIHLFWPLALIAIGITKLLSRRTGTPINGRPNNVGSASQ